jgi:hypothetical protein
MREGSDGANVSQAKDIIGGLHANPAGTGTPTYKNGMVNTKRKLN